MGNENAVSGNAQSLHGRPVTRATSSALRACGQTKSSEAATSQTQGRVLKPCLKRAALEDKKSDATKRRAVLKDVTNVENIKQTKKELPSSSKVAPSAASKAANVKVGVVSNSAGNLSGCTSTSASLGTNNPSRFLEKQSSRLPPRRLGRSASKDKAARSCFGGASSVPSIPKFVDIDSDDKDPLQCSLYAPEIYDNMRVAELDRRPYHDFMERIQKDVTHTMRGILVDWLVEVSEEYALVPDTLYHTVYLIDWFMSGNCLDRQRLQLLGITCMLIASKYEEICAPRVEEFCFITDNTYTRDQVLEMESEVLKYFSFQIYTPSSKTFLRRFLRAAQASQLKPSLEIEFLANYLTELTLIEYQFLIFLPSIIAASAVFLANWTLNQSRHPWNPTLEHYTTYKASDLKTPVHALRDLQRNTKDCPLSAIRMKYRQEKFKSVAVLTSPEIPDTLF